MMLVMIMMMMVVTMMAMVMVMVTMMAMMMVVTLMAMMMVMTMLAMMMVTLRAICQGRRLKRSYSERGPWWLQKCKNVYFVLK